MFRFFRRLLTGKESVTEVNSEADGEEWLLYSATGVANSLFKPKYRVASCQSKGLERQNNEDTLFTLTSVLGGMNDPLAFNIYLVADGMGGHQSGEVASRLAAQAASQHLLEGVFSDSIYENGSLSSVNCIRLVKEAVDVAQNLILQRVPGGGTTLTLTLGIGDQFFSAHVGDSRLYLIDLDGKMRLKTKDHSLVKRLVDLGEITEREAGTHPQRNVLYRALGQIDQFEADTDQFSLEKGEKLIICSDGLWGVLSLDEMQAILKEASDLDQAACDFVRAANEAGGPDNISVILAERLA